jgi:hypothetical protein
MEFDSCSLHVASSNRPKIYVFMCSVMSYIIQPVSVVVVSLMRLESCVGSVCGGDTSLMCHGRDVHGWVQ